MARHCVCSGTASMIGSVRRCLTSVTALSGQMEDKEGLKLRIQRLLAAKSGIKEALHRHKDELAAMRECTLPPLELILTLANNITSTHAAPAGWVEGTPLIKSHPPAPQLVDMREGFLAKYNAEYVKSHGGGEADVDVQADAVVSTTASRSGRRRRMCKRASFHNAFNYATNFLFYLCLLGRNQGCLFATSLLHYLMNHKIVEQGIAGDKALVSTPAIETTQHIQLAMPCSCSLLSILADEDS
jgi:hypothetical protein